MKKSNNPANMKYWYYSVTKEYLHSILYISEKLLGTINNKTNAHKYARFHS